MIAIRAAIAMMIRPTGLVPRAMWTSHWAAVHTFDATAAAIMAMRVATSAATPRRRVTTPTLLATLDATVAPVLAWVAATLAIVAAVFARSAEASAKLDTTRAASIGSMTTAATFAAAWEAL